MILINFVDKRVFILEFNIQFLPDSLLNLEIILANKKTQYNNSLNSTKRLYDRARRNIELFSLNLL
ncbi:hypothetical protein LEP1GSC082_0427 [Leptospira kirschneri str. H2]|uniref:Uncharacterized protein n=2 Tax=Leptospira kirschneri TaxID=29507 RepID=A0A0E2B846_9LEPT|nr:hypothetical protein LEP1GSC081_0367 [Leptospira kirschneri str. H1]EKO61744.1 hypothetical protein LEP1GSC082_0427 [Leptospira kirschneri str. H2]EMK24598.1 hypothetical protein LEP1GSC008_2440 [Leptospira kirschneri serovar Bulgarica str. Nikolaevo]